MLKPSRLNASPSFRCSLISPRTLLLYNHAPYYCIITLLFYNHAPYYCITTLFLYNNALYYCIITHSIILKTCILVQVINSNPATSTLIHSLTLSLSHSLTLTLSTLSPTLSHSPYAKTTETPTWQRRGTSLNTLSLRL
jgi:hypothetical protein